VKFPSANHTFPLTVAVELPSKRGANQDAGDGAKSNGTEQAPSHRRPLIRNPVNLMNGLAGGRVNRRFRSRDANFFIM
jgi:hypothetical protein